MQSQRFLSDVLKRDGNNFDILRLIAALGVIIGHAYPLAPHPPMQDGVQTLLQFDYSGSLAVKFFFFLSGLLVTNSIIAKPDAFQFLFKRACRIFPGLLFCLLFTVIIVGPLFTRLTRGEYFFQKDTWKYLVDNFTLLEMRWRLPGVFSESKYGVNGSLWTLPYEVLCYILLAVFYGLGLLRNKIVSNVFFVIVILVSAFAPQFLLPYFARNPEATYLPACFALGALFSNNKTLIPVQLSHFLLIWILAFAVRNSAVYQLVFYVAFFYSALFLASLQWVRKYLKLPFDASYGVYIYGFLIQQCLVHLYPGLSLHTHQLFAGMTALLFGIASWYLIEKRSIAWGHRMTSGNLSLSISKKWSAVLPTLKNSFQKDDTSGTRNFLIFVILSVLAFLIHAIVLKFIFPGYYSPLYPQHSDFYIPVTFAHSTDTFRSLLLWPRPVTMIFAKFIGYFGIHGSIAWVIAIVCMNTALSALLLIRLFNLTFSKLLILVFGLYCYLLFSQPFFYVFYAQDIGAQLSYFFLVTGGYIFYALFNKRWILGAFLLFAFALLAFLSKETYGLAGLLFSFAWFLYYRKISLIKAYLPGIMVAAALLVALGVNFLVKSIFVDLKAGAGTPYEISINPKKLFYEWALYAKQAMNLANLFLVILLIYLNYKDRSTQRTQRLFITLGCICAAVLSWLPNALLPNHHFNGYSFNGAYLLYLPLLLLPKLRVAAKIRSRAFLFIAVLCLISPLLNGSKYTFNKWVLLQEDTQRNLLNALDPLIKTIQPSEEPQKILIAGITFPFHPFAFPQSLRVFPNARFANFDIVNYDSNRAIGPRKDLVRFINQADTALVNYQQKWFFDNEGKLVKKIDVLTEHLRARQDSAGLSMNITRQNFNQFQTEGFYNEENGIRWTNGNASIRIHQAIDTNDSILVTLQTYLPPISKDIYPKLSLAGKARVYQSAVASQKGDIFYYLFIVPGKDTIQKLMIESAKVDASPDTRILSFPFIGLQLNARSRRP